MSSTTHHFGFWIGIQQHLSPEPSPVSGMHFSYHPMSIFICLLFLLKVAKKQKARKPFCVIGRIRCCICDLLASSCILTDSGNPVTRECWPPLRKVSPKRRTATVRRSWSRSSVPFTATVRRSWKSSNVPFTGTGPTLCSTALPDRSNVPFDVPFTGPGLPGSCCSKRRWAANAAKMSATWIIRLIRHVVSLHIVFLDTRVLEPISTTVQPWEGSHDQSTFSSFLTCLESHLQDSTSPAAWCV